jgi:hypothetical protein
MPGIIGMVAAYLPELRGGPNGDFTERLKATAELLG